MAALPSTEFAFVRIIEAARSQGEIQGATETAMAGGMTRGQQMDVKTSRQLVCPSCKAETHGAKFCPECGEKTG